MKNIYQQSFLHVLAIISALVTSSVSHAAITPFSDNFQSYTTDSGFAPWQFFSDNGGLGEYGTVLGDGPPPTDPSLGGISALTEFEGEKFLNFFANYNNAAVHSDPNLRETISFFRAFEFTGSDTASGATWVFDFQYYENMDFPITDDDDTVTGAFIQVIDESQTDLYFDTVDTRQLAKPDSPTDGQISITLDTNWTEGVLLVGFYNIAGNYDNSGRFYDNVNFAPAVPVPAAIWLFSSGLIGLIGIARRKKAYLYKR